MKKTLKWIMVGILAAVGAQAQVVTMWNDSFTNASLNANFTTLVFGGTVVQTNGTLQMSTGTASKLLRAHVYTAAGQAGETTYNGNAVYDYNAHTVSTRFDLNSNNQTNLTGSFEVNMGQLNITANDIAGYTGFRISLLQSAATGDDILRAQEYSNGVEINNTWMFLAAGERTTAFGFDVTGNNVALWLEGNTFAGGATDSSYTLTGTSTASSYNLSLGARGSVNGTASTVVLDSFGVSVTPLPEPLPPGVVWDESFDSEGLNLNLGFRTAFGTMTQDGLGTLELDVPATNSAFGRSVVYATTGQRGATEFNGNPIFDFNAHMLSTRFDFNSSNMADSNGLFVVDMGQLYVPGSDATVQTGFRVQLDCNSNAVWEIQFVEQAVGGTPVSTTTVNLDAQPTALGFDVLGKGVNLWVEGANFTAGGTNTAWSMSTNYTYSSYAMALGVRNKGGDATNTAVHVGLDSFWVFATAYDNPYDAWAFGWGEDVGSETNDYDGDFVDNLAEYGLNGDPTDPADKGQTSTTFDGTDLVYVHAQHSSDPNLTYWLETTDDLVLGSWTNIGYSVIATNVTGETYDHVTNTVPTTADQTFIRLRIQN